MASGPINGARREEESLGALPIVEELQSEGGAAGALHGALQAGAFEPRLPHRRAAADDSQHVQDCRELTPATMHVTARTLATHALSIFGDHSDVMACRSTGWAMLASNSVQEVHDLALVAQVATLEARIPSCISSTASALARSGQDSAHQRRDIRALVDDKYLVQFRKNALTPDRPIIRGTAQNPESSSRRARHARLSTMRFPESCNR